MPKYINFYYNVEYVIYFGPGDTQGATIEGLEEKNKTIFK